VFAEFDRNNIHQPLKDCDFENDSCAEHPYGKRAVEDIVETIVKVTNAYLR
jgi:hypothetical protein